jgi:hypothetical protein
VNDFCVFFFFGVTYGVFIHCVDKVSGGSWFVLCWVTRGIWDYTVCSGGLPVYGSLNNIGFVLYYCLQFLR